MNYKILINLILSLNFSFFIKLINIFFKKLPLKMNNNSLEFCYKNKEDLESYLLNLDKNLFKESKKINELLNKKSQKKIREFNFELGGGANCILIYFFSRYYKPEIIYETGVSYGFSSNIFLNAIKKNNIGLLYSSDLPYLKIKNSQSAIGCLVDDGLKKYWKLNIKGDTNSALEFTKGNKLIDLFHYDSDKSFLGKFITFNIIKKKFSKNCIIIFDDIQTDNFFPYLVKKNSFNYKVFYSKHDKCYQGIIFFE